MYVFTLLFLFKSNKFDSLKLELYVCMNRLKHVHEEKCHKKSVNNLKKKSGVNCNCLVVNLNHVTWSLDK
jgi:hypothetical protein